MKDPATGAVNFEVFNDVAAIETPDDLTVVIRMSQVNAPFLSRLAENGAGVIIPDGSGDIQGTTPTGAGPFRFVRREFGNEVEFVRFDDYWDGAPHLDGVLSREVTEPTVRLTGIQTGEMHLINDIPLDRVDALKQDPDLQVLTWFPLSWAFLNFNHAVKPFDDPRVRKALDLMVDKEILVQGALWGQGVVTASPSFPTSPSFNDALTARAQDYDAARALLAEAGFGPGELEFVFKTTTNYPWHVEATQILVEWFRQGGVNAVGAAAHLVGLAEPVLDRSRLPGHDDELLHPVGAGLPLLLALALDRRLQLPQHQGREGRRADGGGPAGRRPDRAGRDLQGGPEARAGRDPRRGALVPERDRGGAPERGRARSLWCTRTARTSSSRTSGSSPDVS